MRDYDYNHGSPKYLLESIEDGELCWWGNVGVNTYSREQVAKNPCWQWDDKQFAFGDRWSKVAKQNDAYIVLPVSPKFTNTSVTLDVRIRYGLSEFKNPKTFDNYKKTTMKMMDEYYKESVEKYNNEKGKSRESLCS